MLLVLETVFVAVLRLAVGREAFFVLLALFVLVAGFFAAFVVVVLVLFFEAMFVSSPCWYGYDSVFWVVLSITLIDNAR